MKKTAFSFLAAGAVFFLMGANSRADKGEVREIFDLIRSGYVDPSVLKDKKIDPQDLNGLLDRLGTGAALMSEASRPNTRPQGIAAEMLPYGVGYWRLATFHPAKGWAALEKQLVEWEKAHLTGLVIDVRDFQAAGDYAGAAQAASYFTPAGSVLFSVQGLQVPQRVYQNSRTARRFSFPVVVVINRRTVGAAEAFAAVMRNTGKAILLGRSTAGQAGLYTETQLSSGRYLRMATAQAILADGSKLYGRPVQPDIALFIDDQKEKEVLYEIRASSAQHVVKELPIRKKMSEASLVREENPEYDAALEAQLLEKQVGAGQFPPVFMQDVALVRALDVLRAIQISQMAALPAAPAAR
jgi:hypothetical protein